MIANPEADQEEAFRLLLSTNPKTRKDPDMYIVKKNPMSQIPGAMGMNPFPNQMGDQDQSQQIPSPYMPAPQTPTGAQNRPNSPVANQKQQSLPQSFSTGKLK